MATQYRKKLGTVEAVQFDGTNQDELMVFGPIMLSDGVIMLMGGNMPSIEVTDWIVSDAGQYTQFSDGNFRVSYEEATVEVAPPGTEM